ncbi:MAG: aldehyde dehydrogenase family protein [Phycisphaerales bacterium]|nr:aldehyde dehydrogenase family protein [Phycisphaerales bacterium]
MPSNTNHSTSIAPIRERLIWIRRLRKVIIHQEEAINRVLREELAKSQQEVLTADLMPLLAACRWHEKHAKKLLRPRRVRQNAWWQLGQKHWVYRVPLGHVAIIATWNYPIQLLGIQILQALLGGNRVTVKPSEHAPRSQAALLAAFWQAGVPRSLLQSKPATREAGKEMLREQAFDHIVFTGSTEVGREIASVAANMLTKSTLELSGRDSAFVLPDADPNLAAQAIWEAVELNGGQTCMAPRRALVFRPVYSALLKSMSRLAASAQPRRLISKGQAEFIYHLACQAIAEGGVSLSGTLEVPRDGWIRPIVIANCPPEAALVAGEHFGPALALIPVDSMAQALEIHHQCDQHLATSIFTQHPRRARDLMPLMGSGTVHFNDVVRPAAHPATSILGQGASGWGASQGAMGLLEMTRPLQVSTSPGWSRPSESKMTVSGFSRLRSLVLWTYGRRGRRSLDHPPTAAWSLEDATRNPDAVQPSTNRQDPEQYKDQPQAKQLRQRI